VRTGVMRRYPSNEAANRSGKSKRDTNLQVRTTTTTKSARERAEFNSPKNAKSKSFAYDKDASSSVRSLNIRSSAPVTRGPYENPGSPIASVSRSAVRKSSPKNSPRRAEAKKSQSSSGSSKPKTAIFSPGKYHEDETKTEQTARLQRERIAQLQQERKKQQEEEEDYDDGFDPFLFIKSLPRLSDVVAKRTTFCIPPKSRNAPKITLALDLDETLVHCCVTPIDDPELTFTVNFNNAVYSVYVRTRPYLMKFLKQVSKWFEIVLFTASQEVYADKLLDILDPRREYIQHRVFRDSCVCVNGNYLKDLTILGRDMKTTAIIDNSVQAFGFQLNNGIPIESWFEDPKDCELLNMLSFLEQLKDVRDVRPLIRDTFKLKEFVDTLPDR
jgi:CTD small phosphatase-like protein 2